MQCLMMKYRQSEMCPLPLFKAAAKGEVATYPQLQVGHHPELRPDSKLQHSCAIGSGTKSVRVPSFFKTPKILVLASLLHHRQHIKHYLTADSNIQ